MSESPNSVAFFRPSPMSSKVLAVGVAVILAVWLPSVDARQPPTFEVVSIKPSTTTQDVGAQFVVQPKGRFVVTNIPVGAIVLLAYELADYFQVDGLPEWTRKDLYDIEAQAPAGVKIAFPGQGTALPALLKAMLADRMQLSAHLENRSTPMFALVIARADGTLGPSLTRATIDCTTASTPPPASAGQTPSGSKAPACGNSATRESFTGKGIPLDRMIRLILSPRVGRPIVDRTGLSGPFDMVLRFRPPDLRPGAAPGGPAAPASDPDLPPIETALQEQLGLKLQPIREPADVLVIDRIERPQPN